MNRAQKLMTGGLLAAVFSVFAGWPVENRMEGRVVATNMRGSSKPGVCDVEQVRMDPEPNSNIPFQDGNPVTLDVRALGLRLACRDDFTGMYRFGKAEIQTSRGVIIWDRLNSQHGLRTTKFEPIR